jgi:quinol monooxygenase YgiN
MAFAALFQGIVAPAHVDAVKTALTTLAQASREQPGTIRYEFYSPENRPTEILLFAIWQSEADWKAHVASDVHTRYINSLPAGALANPPVMTRLQALDSN